MKPIKWIIFAGMLLMASPSLALELKIATLSPEGSEWMQKIQAGADEVSRETDNRVRFKFFPGGIMGNDKAVMRKIRIGQLHGGAVTAGSLFHIYGDGNVYSLPLKFKSFQEVDYVRERMDPMLMEGFEKKGFVILGLAGGGFAYVMSNKPIRTSEDLHKQKVWIPSNDLTTAKTLKALGIHPIPLPIAEVRTSLQTGLVDTIPAPPIAAIVLQWHTRVKYITEIPLSYVYGILTIDRRTFSKLSPADQQVVRKVMGRVFKDIDGQNRRDTMDALAALRNNGIKFVKPTADAETQWRSAGAKVIRSLLEAGEISSRVVERLDSLLADYRSGKT
jgi:TRAP-type transport system periplasmic protein